MTTQKQLSECEKCGRKSEVVMLGQQCPFCDKEVNALEKEIEAFEEQYGGFNLCEVVNKNDHDRLASFLRQSLLRFTRSVVDEAMPEERGTKNYLNSYDAIANSDKDYGFNACRTQFQENVERILNNKE